MIPSRPMERWFGRVKAWRRTLADGSTAAAGQDLDVFILAVLLAMFCLRIWDLGIVHSDDAAWALRAWQARWGIIWEWATRQGRVWALVSGPLLFVALKIKGSFIGNLAIAGTFAIFFVLFHWVVAVHFGRRTAILAACLNLGLYAMRWDGSLITAYPVFMWVLGSLYLVALLALERYFATGKRIVLVTSLALFLCSLFLHEGVTVLFALLYPLAAIHHRSDLLRGGGRGGERRDIAQSLTVGIVRLDNGRDAVRDRLSGMALRVSECLQRDRIGRVRCDANHPGRARVRAQWIGPPRHVRAVQRAFCRLRLWGWDAHWISVLAVRATSPAAYGFGRQRARCRRCSSGMPSRACGRRCAPGMRRCSRYSR